MGSSTLWTRAFVLAFVAHFMHSLALHVFVHLPGFLHGHGAGTVEIGVIVAVMPAAAIASRPWIGRVMDRHGRRVVVRTGGALAIVACLSYLTVTDLGPWLYFVRAIHGVADGMLFSSLFTMAADLTPPSQRARGIALFGVSGLLPLSLGGLLGDVIAVNGSFDGLFWVAGLLSALGLAWSWPLRDSRPTDAGTTNRSFFAAAREPALAPLWLIAFVFAFALASYFTFLKTFVIETGIGTVGLFFTVYTVAAVATRLGFGWVPDRFGLERTLRPALLTLAAGLASLSVAQSAWPFAAAGILCGIGHAYAFPIVSALVVTRSRANERGAAMTLFTALFDLGILVGSPTLGLVVRGFGYQTMFAFAALVVIAGDILFRISNRPRD